MVFSATFTDALQAVGVGAKNLSSARIWFPGS
jgi:hypothetical protein